MKTKLKTMGVFPWINEHARIPAEVYLGLYKTPMMESSSIIDVWQGPKYTSVLAISKC